MRRASREPAQRASVDGSSTRYWSVEDIRQECGISLSSAWRLVRREGFPAPVVLGPRLIRWRQADVVRFIDDLQEPGRYADVSPSAVMPTSAFTTRPVRKR